jgi:hypothetical protein
MPFTPTHALAAVPLCRWRVLDPAALAIGCMLPDLPMFLPATPSYGTTHDFIRGPLSCLPYGLLAFIVFRRCRGQAIAFLPEPMRRRLAAYAAPRLQLSFSAWLGIALALVLGVWTHILWDSFTHADRFGSKLFPELMTTWLTLHGYRLRGYEVLQHGCSVVGLPILALVVARWYARQPRDGVATEAASVWRRALLVVLALAAPIFAAGYAFGRVQRSDPDFWHSIAFELVTFTLSAYVIGAALLTLPRALSAESQTQRGTA